jgi:hypothetical protein
LNECARGLVRVIAPLVADALMQARNLRPGFALAITTALTALYSLLRGCELISLRS